MIIFRALNDSDIALNPQKNGLYSKLNIKLAVESLFDFLLCADGISLTKGEYKGELEKFKKDSIKYCLPRISELTNDKKLTLDKIKEHMCIYLTDRNYDALIPYLVKFFDITSTKNAHLLVGNNYESDWISFTKDLEVLKNYYLGQKNKHMVVGMDSNINIILDCDTIAYDLSSKEAALANPFLYNKSEGTGIYEETDVDSMAVRYANKSSEVIYYNHVPKERIFILNPLQLDMLYNGMLDDTYLTAPLSVKVIINHLLMNIVSYKISDSSEFMKYAFEKIYLDAIPLDTLSKTSGINYYELLNAKEELLNILNSVSTTNLLEKVKKPARAKIRAIERD